MTSEHVNPPRHLEPPGTPRRLRLGVIRPTRFGNAHAVKMAAGIQGAINRNDTPVTFRSWTAHYPGNPSGPKAHTAGGVEHHLGKTETAFQSCLKGRSSRKWTRQTPVTRPLPKDFGLSTLRRKCRKSPSCACRLAPSFERYLRRPANTLQGQLIDIALMSVLT